MQKILIIGAASGIAADLCVRRAAAVHCLPSISVIRLSTQPCRMRCWRHSAGWTWLLIVPWFAARPEGLQGVSVTLLEIDTNAMSVITLSALQGERFAAQG